MKNTYLAMGCTLILLGLVIVIVPTGFITAIMIGIGIAAISSGIFNFFTIRNLIEDSSFKNAVIIQSVLSIVIGILAVIAPLFIAKTVWKFLLYVQAIGLVISALIECYGMIKLRHQKIDFGTYLTQAIISILLAIILFAIPTGIGIVLLRIIGAFVLLSGVFSIIWGFKISKIL